MATAEEIVVKLTAQTAQLKAGMAEGAAVVKATQDEMAASMQTSMNAFRQFDAIQKGSITTAQELAAAQSAVKAAQASAAFTAKEIAEKEALVALAMKKVGSETQAASGILSAFTRNSRTAYTTSALISDAMTGQFSRSRREVAAFANETGFMSRALKFAVSPAGLLAGAVGFLGVATVKADEDLNDFNNVVERTNGYMGTSAGELQAAAQKIESLGVSYSDAKQAVIDLASSGRFTGKQLLQAATSAAEFAQLTGEKVSEVDKLLVEMATNPQKALDELVEKYHRVTPAQAELIEGLIKQGDKAAATAAMVQAMGNSVAASFDKQTQHVGILDRMLHTLGRDFGEVWRGIGESLNVATGGGDAAEKLTMLQHQLADMRVSGETTGGYAVAYQELRKQAAELQTIIDKQHQSAAAAKKTGDAYAQAHPAQGTFAAFQKNGLEGIDINGNLTKQLSTLEAAQHVSYDKMEAVARNYWQYVLEHAKAGTAQYIEAYHQVEEYNKRVDDEQLADSNRVAQQREQAGRRAAETAKQTAAARARFERDTDAEIANEIKQEANARRQAALTDAQTARQTALSRIATAKQAAQTEYSEGTITAGQLLQIENNLVQQKLAADVAYLKAKQALDAGDVNAEKKDATQLGVVKQKAAQEQLANLARFHQQAEQQWRRYTQRVQGMVASQVSAMLFQHQTLRAAAANIAESMASTWIAQGIRQLFSHQAVEAGKTAATVAGNATRVAADTAGQAESLAVQGASAIKWILTEAAKAAAGAFNAMVSIPYIGPFLAVGASIAAFAAVGALVGKVASAEGGWERVPADGMTTQLHKDEMVLPAHIAEPMRKMTRNGGGSGVTHNHFNVQSWDSRDLGRFVRRHGGTLSTAMNGLRRNGYR